MAQPTQTTAACSSSNSINHLVCCSALLHQVHQWASVSTHQPSTPTDQAPQLSQVSATQADTSNMGAAMLSLRQAYQRGVFQHTTSQVSAPQVDMGSLTTDAAMPPLHLAWLLGLV